MRRFQKDKEQFIAVLEGKGTRDPLDRPFAGRRMSAVDQAYQYAILGHIFEQSITNLERLRFRSAKSSFVEMGVPSLPPLYRLPHCLFRSRSAIADGRTSSERMKSPSFLIKWVPSFLYLALRG